MARRGTTRRELFRLGAAGLAAVTLLRRTAAETGGDRPPNIVVILSDNHGADAMGCAGHPFVRTPALDRLAREGVTFGDAFCTTPLCSPARASFLTGRYASAHRVRNNGALSGWNERHATLLELLKNRAGYATALIGKWHMPASGLPALRGVDHFVTFTINDGQGKYEDCPLVVDGVDESSQVSYLTDELTDRAIAWIDRQTAAPCCLYLSHKAAHYPWRPAGDLAGMYAGEPVTLPPGATPWAGFVDGQIWGGFDRPIPSAYRSYMATITSLDRAIGRLLDHLDARGLARDTVVVHASGNGFLFGEHGKVALRWPFEEVRRIPWLVRAPRHADRPGRRASQMALNIDLAPTLLDMAGVAPPPEMQGTGLVPALRDGPRQERDRQDLPSSRCSSVWSAGDGCAPMRGARRRDCAGDVGSGGENNSLLDPATAVVNEGPAARAGAAAAGRPSKKSIGAARQGATESNPANAQTGRPKQADPFTSTRVKPSRLELAPRRPTQRSTATCAGPAGEASCASLSPSRMTELGDQTPDGWKGSGGPSMRIKPCRHDAGGGAGSYPKPGHGLRSLGRGQS